MIRSSSLILRRVAASTRVSALRAIGVQRTITFSYATEHSHQLNRCNRLATSSSTKATPNHDMLDWKQIPVGKMNNVELNAALQNIAKNTAIIESDTNDEQNIVDHLEKAMVIYERLLDEYRHICQNSIQKRRVQSSIQGQSATTINGAANFTNLQRSVLTSKITRDVIQKWFQMHKKHYSNENLERKRDTETIPLSPQHMYEWLERLRTNIGAVERFPVIDESSYRLVLIALSLQQRKTKSSNIGYATKILQNFVYAYKSKKSTLLLSEWFIIVIKMCTHLGQFDVADKMLKEAENVYYRADDGRRLPFCNAHMYEILMTDLRRLGHYKKARSYFDRFMSIPTSQPTLDICYLQLELFNDDNVSDTTEIAQNAEDLLLKMLDGAKTRGWDTYPTVGCVSKVVHCWSKVKDPGVLHRIEIMLDIADMLPWEEDLGKYVTIYTRTMFSWSLTGSGESTDQVRTLYDRLVKNVGDENLLLPYVRAKVALSQLIAWSRSDEPDAYSKARNIYDKSWELSKNDIRTSVLANKFQTHMLFACGKAGKPEEAEELLTTIINNYMSGDKNAFPRSASFINVAQAWRNSKRKDARSKIRKIFQYMVSLRTHKDFTHLEAPSSTMYNLILQTYTGSRHPDVALEGEKYFHELLNSPLKDNKLYQPNDFTFKAALGLWQHISDPIAVEHATSIMNSMISWSERNASNSNLPGAYKIYEEIVLTSSLPLDDKDRLLTQYRQLCTK